MMSRTASENPYIGPRPFKAGETLYGREREITELNYRLNAERIVLLYSPSGAGKTSLVQAGLVPELAKSFDVRGPVRVNQEPAVAGVNRYVASANLGFEEGLPEKLRRPGEELAALTLAGYFAGRPRRRSAPRNVLLVFDQFEEVLTVDPLAVKEKRELFDQLGELLRNPRVWALFVLREDYLAPLDPYARQVPTQLKNRFRIDLLGLEAAREAMVRTAEDGGRAFPAAGQLVRDLATMKVQQADGSFVKKTGHHVEPVQLQVVCLRLWDEMPSDDRSIDSEDLEQYGDVTEALATYYAASVTKIADKEPTRERAIRDWFGEELITESGIRGQVLRGAGASGGLANELIERLLDTHLIRAEKRAGATWYELAHDRLVEPVRDDNEAWRQQHLSEVQRRASLWERQGHMPGLLLAEEELADGERWARENEAVLIDVERRFLDESRKERKSRKEREQMQRVRRWAILALFVIAVAVGAAVLVWLQWRNAEKQREKAEDLARTAVAGNLLAEDQSTWANLLLLEVSKPEDTPAAERTLYRALAAPVSVMILQGTSWVNAASFSPDGTQVVTASDDGTVRIWNVATGEEIAPIKGHTSSVIAASFSPDGAWIVTASRDNTARIWNVATDEEIATLEGHEDDVNAASFSPDGTWVVTASSDDTARIWKVTTGEEIRPLEGHTEPVIAASFSPDGSRVVTASDDKTVRIWNVKTGDEISLNGHTHWVRSASFSPDGSRIVTASWDETARIWNVTSGAEITTLKGHTKPVTTASFSSDGAHIVTASDDGTARVWDAATGAEITTLKGHTKPVTAASFSSDGLRIVTGCRDNTVRIWNATTGAEIAILKGFTKTVTAASFSPDGARIVTASGDGTTRIWNVTPGAELANLQGHTEEVTAASFSPDGARIVTASGDHTARIWNAATVAELATLHGHTEEITAASFSPDGSRIVTASEDHTARTWNVTPGAEIATLGSELATLQGHTEEVTAASFSPDGSRIVTASGDRTARIWNVMTGAELFTLQGHTEEVTAASFNPDGSRIVTASGDHTARIWNAVTGAELFTLQGHTEEVTAASFSPDGSRIVTACWDRTARIWDAATGTEIAILQGHMNMIWAASFNRDGTRIVTASGDQTARIWDAATGDEIATLKGPTDWVRGASFSLDGTRIVTASEDRTARVWDAATGAEIATFSGHAARVGAASFSPDGSRIITASSDRTARIWAIGEECSEYLRSRIRARTRLCLSPDFRQQTLGETLAVAESKHKACKACVRVFFEFLGDAPLWECPVYVDAWRTYKDCLLEERADVTDNGEPPEHPVAPISPPSRFTG